MAWLREAETRCGAGQNCDDPKLLKQIKQTMKSLSKAVKGSGGGNPISQDEKMAKWNGEGPRLGVVPAGEGLCMIKKLL